MTTVVRSVARSYLTHLKHAWFLTPLGEEPQPNGKEAVPLVKLLARLGASQSIFLMDMPVCP